MTLKTVQLIGVILCLFGVGGVLFAQEPNANVNAMSSVLNLRSDPQAQAPIIAELGGNTPLFVAMRTSDNRWYQARTPDGQLGWVASAYITLHIDQDSLPIVGVTAGAPTPSEAVSPRPDEDASTTHRQATVHHQAGTGGSNFAKVGDSITYSDLFLNPIGVGAYHLGPYGHLQGVIDHFIQGDNSFVRQSLASGNGWTTETVLNHEFAHPQACHQGESPLLCEYRLISPSFALIMLGSNDVALLPQDVYAHNLGTIVRLSLEHDVQPILSTIPYRVGYEAQVERFNQTIRDVATLYNVPVWDYFTAMLTLPNAGLSDDGLHPSVPNGGFEAVADFAEGVQSGYAMRNLTALQVLYDYVR